MPVSLLAFEPRAFYGPWCRIGRPKLRLHIGPQASLRITQLGSNGTKGNEVQDSGDHHERSIQDSGRQDGVEAKGCEGHCGSIDGALRRPSEEVWIIQAGWYVELEVDQQASHKSTQGSTPQRRVNLATAGATDANMPNGPFGWFVQVL
eukprot:2703187-Amphidinium_carterae.1